MKDSECPARSWWFWTAITAPASAALRAHGFNGTVAYEMCSPLRDGGDLGTLDRYARGFLEFIRPWLGEPGAASH